MDPSSAPIGPFPPPGVHAAPAAEWTLVDNQFSGAHAAWSRAFVVLVGVGFPNGTGVGQPPTVVALDGAAALAKPGSQLLFGGDGW